MANRADIKAGSAFVELFVKGTQLEQGLKAASKHLESFGSGIQSFGKTVASFGAAAVGGFAAATHQFVTIGDAAAKAAQRTGLSVSAFQELSYAAQTLAGASADEFEGAFKRMQALIHDVSQGSEAAGKSFAELGVDVNDLLRASPEQQFLMLSDALSKIEDSSQRAALAMEVFGKSGTKLLPMVTAGAKGIETARKEFEKLGLSLTDEQANQAVELGDAIERVKGSLTGVALAVGTSLAPALRTMADRIIAMIVPISNWIKENNELIVSLAKTSAVVALVGLGLTGFGKMVIAVSAALNLLSKIVGIFLSLSRAAIGFGTAIATLSNPVGLAVVGIMAFGGAIAYASGIIPQLLDVLRPLVDAIQAFAKALMSGDFSKAWDIAKTSAMLFGSVAKDVFNQIPKFAGYAMGRAAKEIVDAFRRAYEWIASSTGTLFQGIIDAARDLGPQLLAAIVSGNTAGSSVQIALSMRDVLADLRSAGAGFAAGFTGGEIPTLIVSDDTRRILAQLMELSERPITVRHITTTLTDENPFAASSTPIPPTSSGVLGGTFIDRPAGAEPALPDMHLSDIDAYNKAMSDLSDALFAGGITMDDYDKGVANLGKSLLGTDAITAYRDRIALLSKALSDGSISLDDFNRSKDDALGAVVGEDPIKQYMDRMKDLQALFDSGDIDVATFKREAEKALPGDAQAIIERNKTPLERFNEQITKARDLFDAGLIDQGTFEREQERLQGELRGDERGKRDAGRVFTTFSGAALAAQALGAGIGGGKDPAQMGIDKIGGEAVKHTDLLKEIKKILKDDPGLKWG